MNARHIISVVFGTVVFGAPLAFTLGCSGAPEGTANFETEGWIDTSPPGPPSEKPSPYGEEDGEEEGEDEDGEEEGEEDGEDEAGALFVIYAGYEDGVVSNPEGEFFSSDGQQATCEAFFSVEVGQVLDGCQECDQAFTFTFGEPEVDIDVDGACGTYGIDGLGGSSANFGWNGGESLLREVDGVWTEVGEAFAEDGEIILEWSAD